jgi:FkbM family methyltransferase
MTNFLPSGVSPVSGSIRAFAEKVADGEAMSAIRDTVRYYPRGLLASEFTTPDGVRLSLEELSPITIGRYRAGDAEPPERALLASVPDDMPTVELGAGVGYITVLMNRKTDQIHLALEPNPRVFPLLERTRELNDASFESLQLAYHPTADEVQFPDTTFFKTVSLNDTGGSTVAVEATSLEGLLDRCGIDGCHLHVDIEGGEELLLNEELDVVAERCESLSVELHRRRAEEPDRLLAELREMFDEVDRRGPDDVPVILFERA